MIKTELHWIFMGLVFFGLLAYMTYPFLDVFVYGLFIYYVSRPLYHPIKKRIKDESVSALITLILLMLPFIFLSLYTLGVASIEFIKLASTTDCWFCVCAGTQEPMKKTNLLPSWVHGFPRPNPILFDFFTNSEEWV